MALLRAALAFAATAAALVAPSTASAAFGQGASFGQVGAAAGQLAGGPTDVAVDSVTGRIYVANCVFEDAAVTRACNVTVYEADGAFVKTIPTTSADGSSIGYHIAVDGPRKRLLVAEPNLDEGTLTVVAYKTDDLAAAPTTFLSAATTAPESGFIDFAVDQSADAALGGRVFLAYNLGLDSLGAGDSGYVVEYAKDGTRTRKIGSAYTGDGAPPAGQFVGGDIDQVAVASGTHELYVVSAAFGYLDRFATTGTVVAGSHLDRSPNTAFAQFSPIAVRPDGTFYAKQLTVGDQGFALFNTKGETQFKFGSPVAADDAQGIAPGTCGWYDGSLTAATGADGRLVLGSSTTSGAKAVIKVLRAGGTGCGFDPIVDSATVSDQTPIAGTPVSLEVKAHSGATPALGLTYAWDLDGNPATGTDGFETTGAATQTVTPTSAAPLTVRVRVSDSDGTSVVRSLQLNPRTRPAVPAFKLSATTIATGGSVTLDASTTTSPDVPVTKYSWDLGNGAFNTDGGTSPTLTHAFPSAGSYRIRLKVTYGDATATTSAQTLTVNAPAPPAATPAPQPKPTPTPSQPVFNEPIVPIPAIASAIKGSVKKGFKATVTCAAGGSACAGNLTLQSTAKKPVSLAKGSYKLAAGKKGSVTLKLTKAGKKALKKAKKLKAKLLVAPTGGTPSTKSVSLTVSKR